MDIVTWSIGLAVSLVIGWPITEGFVFGLRKAQGFEKPAEEKSVPSWLTGMIERLFFTIAVAYNVGGSITAMMVWIAIKLAANWGPGAGRIDTFRLRIVSSALGGLVSMLFALVGGLIAGGAFF